MTAGGEKVRTILSLDLWQKSLSDAPRFFASLRMTLERRENVVLSEAKNLNLGAVRTFARSLFYFHSDLPPLFRRQVEFPVQQKR